MEGFTFTRTVYRYTFYKRNDDLTRTTIRVFRTNDAGFAYRVYKRDQKLNKCEIYATRKVSESSMHVNLGR